MSLREQNVGLRQQNLSLREQKKARARAEILDAATAIIQRRGFDETTMREIAEAARVSHQTLYNYFPSKASIYQALLAEQTMPLVHKLARIADAGGPDLLEALNRGFKVTFDHLAKSDRRIWREILAHAFRTAPEHTGFFTTYYAGARGRLEQLIAAAKSAGHLEPETDGVLLAQTLYAIVDFAFLSFVLEPEMSARAALERVRAQVSLVVTPYLAGRQPGKPG